MRVIRTMAVVASALCVAQVAQAQFTLNSPAGGTLPATVSPIGGIVTDLIGLNGNRIVAQRAASGLFNGNQGNAARLTIGTQTGFTAAMLAALGGGLAQASFRFTLDDGDNGPGDVEFGENFLLVNNANVGNFSTVQTVRTNSSGVVVAGTQEAGFSDNELRTGFFFTADATALSTIFTGLAGGSLVFEFGDLIPGDFGNVLDFTQGLAPELIDVGAGPVVTPPNTTVPEPATVILLGSGLAVVGALKLRRRAA